MQVRSPPSPLPASSSSHHTWRKLRIPLEPTRLRVTMAPLVCSPGCVPHSPPPRHHSSALASPLVLWQPSLSLSLLGIFVLSVPLTQPCVPGAVQTSLLFVIHSDLITQPKLAPPTHLLLSLSHPPFLLFFWVALFTL